MFVCSEHDWFKIDLPEYLFPSASDVDASVVDTDAIREVCEVRCLVDLIAIDGWYFLIWEYSVLVSVYLFF